MDNEHEAQGEFDFVIKALLGGIIGGFLSIIPIVQVLNYCCCLLGDVGAALGVTLHLRADPDNRMTIGQAAISGAISGFVASIMFSIGVTLMSLLLEDTLFELMRSMGLSRSMAHEMTKLDPASVIMQTCFFVVLFIVFGVISAIATLKLLHSDQCTD